MSTQENDDEKTLKDVKRQQPVSPQGVANRSWIHPDGD
jgi:hypothetical protein